MAKNLWEEETPGRENLKFVWKYYLLAFAGVLIWLCARADRKVKADYALSGRK